MSRLIYCYFVCVIVLFIIDPNSAVPIDNGGIKTRVSDTKNLTAISNY